MSHPDPIQEYLPDEILDDRRSTREQLEQEIEKTEYNLRETLATLRDELDELYTEECNTRETIARLQDELDELGAETQQDLIAEVKPYRFPLS
jgi:peptidoglycan hydrolase CwlO-like protein